MTRLECVSVGAASADVNPARLTMSGAKRANRAGENARMGRGACDMSKVVEVLFRSEPEHAESADMLRAPPRWPGLILFDDEWTAGCAPGLVRSRGCAVYSMNFPTSGALVLLTLS